MAPSCIKGTLGTLDSHTAVRPLSLEEEQRARAWHLASYANVPSALDSHTAVPP